MASNPTPNGSTTYVDSISGHHAWRRDLSAALFRKLSSTVWQRVLKIILLGSRGVKPSRCLSDMHSECIRHLIDVAVGAVPSHGTQYHRARVTPPSMAGHEKKTCVRTVLGVGFEAITLCGLPAQDHPPTCSPEIESACIRECWAA